MGTCIASRFEERNEGIDNFITLNANFIGGEGRYLSPDFCPVDKLFVNWNSKQSKLKDGECKEAYELLKINSRSL